MIDQLPAIAVVTVIIFVTMWWAMFVRDGSDARRQALARGESRSSLVTPVATGDRSPP
jgi:hypothetical protein